MGDLDSLLQDFSYLKSLEHKHVAPKRASKKLQLPDQSCRHAVEYKFKKAGDGTFERILNRPLGRRLFKDFLNEPAYCTAHPAGALLLAFLNEIDELTSDRADLAHTRASELVDKYVRHAAIAPIGPQMWAAGDVKKQFEDNLAMLQKKSEMVAPDASLSKNRNINIKELFLPLASGMKRFLGTDPWSDFKSSRFWGRYLQWKQLEWNMKISASDFDVHRILGRGGFGEVFGCRKFDTGALFAMKKLDKKRLKLKHQEATAVHERNVLAEMSSKFVSNLKYAFHDKDTLYLVLDLLEGGDLNWHLKKLGTFTEAQAKFYAAEIVMGVAHIHDNSMIYRDLKPANVLLDGEGHARISDLGLVRDIKPGKSLPTSECGTHGYMAPEVLEKDREYGPASDWFSLGCTIFQFFTGHTPFRDGKAKVKGKTGKDEIGKRTMRGEVPFPEDFPATAKALVAQLLTVDPAKRLGSAPPPQGAADIRAHKWFADVDWQALMDHKVRPAIVPTHGMVNANGVHDIERFDHHDTRKVKITDEDNQKYYQHFGHIMSHNWQEEVQVMYDIVTKDTDAREDKERRRQERTARQGTGFVAVGEDGAGPIMEGVWLKESRRMKAWNKRYVRLYSDCVCWGDTEHAPAKKVCKLESVALAEVADGVQKSFTVTCDGEVSVFRALYQSDHDLWARLLHAAIEARGPDKNDKGLAEALQPDQDAALRKMSHHGDVLSDAERMKTLDGLRTGSGGSASFASIPEAAGAN